MTSPQHSQTPPPSDPWPAAPASPATNGQPAVPYVSGPAMGPATQTHQFRPGPPPYSPPQSENRGLMIAAVVLSVLVLMAGTGFGVWFFTRPDSASPDGGGPAAAPASVDVKGVVVLQRGQFIWQSIDNPTCEGYRGFDDLVDGAAVTITDANGKVLLVGRLSRGTAQGITTEADGMHRATTCEMPFIVSGVPGGVGPYGVEVTHRGVTHHNENELGSVRLSF